MRLLRRSEIVAESAQATASAAEAVKKAAKDKKSTTTDWPKLITKPNLLDYKSREEEIEAFGEWSWVLEKYLRSVDGLHEGLESDS